MYKSNLTILFCLTGLFITACNSGKTTPINNSSTTTSLSKLQSNPQQIIGYFENSSIYANKYEPSNIPSSVTTIVYAFTQIGNCASPFATDANPTLCNSNPSDGLTGIQDYKLHSDDPYADYTYFDNQGNPASSGNSGSGTLQKAMQQAKANNQQLLLSIGGWSLTTPIKTAVTPQYEQGFISSIISFINAAQSNGNGIINGIDVDFEPNGNNWTISNAANPYPLTKTDLQNYSHFLQDLATQLHAQNKILTIAITGNPEVLKNIDQTWGSSYLGNLANFVDSIDLMTYDYHAQGYGNDAGYTNFNSPLYSDKNQPSSIPQDYDINDAVTYVVNTDLVPANKVVIGSAAYGRVYILQNQINSSNKYTPYQLFSNTTSYAGPNTGNTLTYRQIMTGFYQTTSGVESTGASFIDNISQDYDAGQAISTGYVMNLAYPGFISFDNCAAAFNKMAYAIKNNLRGVMVWELSGDISPNDTLPSGVTYANASLFAGLASALTNSTDTTCYANYPNSTPTPLPSPSPAPTPTPISANNYQFNFINQGTDTAGVTLIYNGAYYAFNPLTVGTTSYCTNGVASASCTDSWNLDQFPTSGLANLAVQIDDPTTPWDCTNIPPLLASGYTHYVIYNNQTKSCNVS